jgi:hypothetical protein
VAGRRSTAPAGGQALTPLDASPWSERHGRVQERFGMSWQGAAAGAEPVGTRVAERFVVGRRTARG